MAIKYFMLYTAKPHIKHNHLREYYEKTCVGLISELLPFIQQHRRHYVTNNRSPALVAAGLPFVEPGFDMIAEFALAHGSCASRLAESLADPDIRTALQRAATLIFDTERTRTFAVEAWSTSPELLARRPAAHAGPPAVQNFVLIGKNPELSRRQFIDHYECTHTQIVLTHLARDGIPLFARYVRNFPVDSDGEATGEQFCSDQAPYDCFGEVAYWSEGDAREFAPIMSQDDVARIFQKDGEIMLKGGHYHQVQVETYENLIHFA